MFYREKQQGYLWNILYDTTIIIFACNNYNVQTCSQLDEILIAKLYNKGDKLQKTS